MVACLEKTEGNSDFHEIVDFLASSSIHHALTVSPPIYTSYIEQFWNTASSQTVNDVKQINATVDSKAVVVTEASIRSSLLFNDVDEGTNRNERDQVQTPHDSPLSGGHIFDRAEGALNLQELSVLFGEECKPASPRTSQCLKSVKRLSMKKRFGQKESVSKQGRKKSKPESTLMTVLSLMIKIMMDASEELAARLQMKEREMYTIEERSKLLAEFFERGKKLLAEERAAAVRNKPPIRTQLRSLMMTYLKHTGKYRHNQLKKKTFEEIQALYIKEQERDADFVPIGSERDEKMIDKMNKKAVGMDEEEVPEETESTKAEVKQEECGENIRKRSIVLDEEEEIDYEVLSMRFSTTTPKGIDLVLWGDLRIMFKETVDGDIWMDQEKWIIKSWTFYENYRVHILALEDGTKIHILAERRYPLIRETLERMIELRLTAESEGGVVFDLHIFIQKQIDEFEGQDGSEKDL
ncbi:hypothetical protein Tco_0589400 [Tanacetum coccineum]